MTAAAAQNLNWPLWPRQREALESIANDQLFGGASEGGKSYFGRVGISLAGIQCEGLQMTLIRKKYEDIISNHLDGDKGFRALLYPLTSKGIVEITDKKIRFPKGNVCTFRHCQDERQFDSAQGNENQIVVVDEAPQIQERLIRAFRGWCRMTPEHLARQPVFWQKKLPWILQTGNPTGQSMNYYKKNYVKARRAFAIDEIGGFRRQYVPSLASDNKSIDLQRHADRLSEIGDAELARALDLGDWDVQLGNYFSNWDQDYNVIERFVVPDFWLRFRTFDYGSYEPWACLWWAVSPGCEIGNRYLPRGCLVCYREWYGCKAEHPQDEKDLLVTNLAPQGWTNKDMALGIVDRTEERFDRQPTFTDKFPFNNLGGRTIAKEFADAGVPLTLGDTDRRNGWAQMGSKMTGEKLIAGSEERWPMLVVFEDCKYCQDYIPMIERNPDEGKQWDAQEDGEPTHVCDCVRLASMAHRIVYDAPTVLDDAAINTIARDPRNSRQTMRRIIPGLPF